MAEQLNPIQLQHAIDRLCDDLERHHDEFKAQAGIAVDAEVDHKRAAAEEMVRLVEEGRKMTADEREARVFIATADAYAARMHAAVARDVAMSGWKTAQSQLSAKQSQLSHMKEMIR